MKRVVSTKRAPTAIGPYSQAVVDGRLLLLSGQIPLDPDTGQLRATDIGPQTEQVLDNLEAVLTAAGASWSDVLRTTIYLVDLSHFATVNEIYGRRLVPPYPARATVQVAGLPRGALVEIDAMAVIRPQSRKRPLRPSAGRRRTPPRRTLRRPTTR